METNRTREEEKVFSPSSSVRERPAQVEPAARGSWFYRASRSQIHGLVLLGSFVLFLINFIADRLLVREWHKPAVMMAVSNAVAAAVIGYLMWKLADYAIQRRKRVEERLEMIAEMNHHVRNALEAISLSAYTTRNQEAIEMISGAVKRIDWALKEILPIAKK
jgi:signal transduction histidine kinase